MNAIEASGVTKAFGGRKAVDEVTFSLPEGHFLTVFGPNGAGKTTLLRMLATLTRPTAGSIAILGVDAKENPDEVRGLVGVVSHDSMLYPDLSALENLEFYGGLYGIADPHARALELLDAVGLKHRRLDYVRTFSRGMVQRVSIARALMNDPDVVLLDEPYSGLDPHAAEVFDSLISEVREDRTFVMVSHDFYRGYKLATDVLVMARGCVVAYAPSADFDEGKLHALYAETVGAGVA